MSKLYVVLLFCLFTICTLGVSAQKTKPFLGGNLILGFPNGDFKTAYKSALGIEGSAGFGGKRIFVLGTLGYVSYKAESGNPYGKITVIPLKAGLRVYPTKRLFLTGNAGYGFLKDETMSKREARFVYDAGVGLHFLLSQISVHYDAWQRKNNAGVSSSIQLKLGLAL